MPKSTVNVFSKKKNSNNTNALEAHIPTSQLSKAVSALVNFITREKQKKKTLQLIDASEAISLIVTLKKTPPKGSNKGIEIQIPNALFNVDDTRICLIVKDEDVKKLKQKIFDDNDSVNTSGSNGEEKEGKIDYGIDKVLSLTKLRKLHSDHASKRNLCNSYDLFLADDRILPMLTKALGEYPTAPNEFVLCVIEQNSTTINHLAMHCCASVANFCLPHSLFVLLD